MVNSKKLSKLREDGPTNNGNYLKYAVSYKPCIGTTV